MFWGQNQRFGREGHNANVKFEGVPSYPPLKLNCNMQQKNWRVDMHSNWFSVWHLHMQTCTRLDLWRFSSLLPRCSTWRSTIPASPTKNDGWSLRAQRPYFCFPTGIASGPSATIKFGFGAEFFGLWSGLAVPKGSAESSCQGYILHPFSNKVVQVSWRLIFWNRTSGTDPSWVLWKVRPRFQQRGRTSGTKSKIS